MSDLLSYSQPALLGAQRLRDAIDLHRSRANPEFSSLVDGYARMWPSMTPELGFSLAVQGVPPDSDLAMQIAQEEGLEILSQTQDSEGLLSRTVGGFVDLVGEGVTAAGDAVNHATRAVTRTGFSVLESAWEEIVGTPLRALAGAASRASGQFAPDDDDGLFDDLLDTAGVLLNPKFWSGEQGLIQSLPEQYGRAGGSSLRGLIGAVAEDPADALAGLAMGSEDVLGNGFFPRGRIGEQAAASREQIRIGGAGAGFGDLVMTGLSAATGVAAPGTEAHDKWSGLLQLGFEIGTDPVGTAASAVSKVNKARQGLGATQVLTGGGRLSPFPRVIVGQTLTEGGTIRTAVQRSTAEVVDDFGRGIYQAEHSGVVPEIVDAYVNTREFTPVAERIREMAVRGDEGLHDLWMATGQKLNPTELRGLRDAALESDATLRSTAASLIRSSNLPKTPMVLERVKEPSRWLSFLPEKEIGFDLGSGNAAIQVDRALIAAKVPKEERARLFARWAEFSEDGRPVFSSGMLKSPEQRASARSIVIDAYKLMEEQLVKAGVDEDRLLRLTDIYNRTAEDTAYLANAMADSFQAGELGRQLGRVGGSADDVRLAAEVAQSIPMPNMAEISREVTGGLLNRKWFKSAFEAELAVSDAVLRAWVPLKLLRGAWTVRVVGEEMVRMSAAGLDTFLTHPASALMWTMGRKGKTPDELVDELDAFHKAALNEVGDDINFVAPSRMIATGEFRLARRPDVATGGTQRGYATGHRLALRNLHDTPLTRSLARNLVADAEEVVPMGKIREDFFTNGGFESWLTTQKSDVVARVRELPAIQQRRLSDAYVAYANALLAEMTGGADELLELVAKGKSGRLSFTTGRNLSDKLRNSVTREETTASLKEFEDALRTYHRQGIGPEAVPTPKFLDDPRQRTAFLDKWLQSAFQFFMGTPSNVLSRNPTFRQAYWRRVSELAPSMSNNVRDDFLKLAREAFPDSTNERRLLERELGRRGGPAELTTQAAADRVAKAHALDYTRDLLYDQQRRGNWSEMLRGIFVFAEAWKEIATTWGRLVGENPNILNRAQQGLSGAREGGIFYTDPTTGDERFAYPGGSWVADLVGLPGGKFEGSVQGLNLFSSSVIPGFGPVIQGAASHFLPHTTDYDWLRDAMMPFGDSESDTPGRWVDEQLPPWMKRFFQAASGGGFDPGQWANAQMDVARALVMADPEQYRGEDGMRRLIEDSRAKTRMAFFIRAGAQFIAPTGPTIQFYGETPSEQTFSVAVLANEYRKLLEETGSDAEATRVFELKFGFDPTYIRQSKTQGINERSYSREGADWERDHQAQVERHRDVIGFFAPPAADAEFDFTAFSRALASGDRQQLTFEQMATLANRRAGAIAFERATEILQQKGVEGAQLTEAQRVLRQQIADEYPGFGQRDVAGVKASNLRDTKVAVEKLREAVQDPVLAETPQGQALVKYLAFRDRFLEEANRRGYQTLGGKNVADLRRALNDLGLAYVREYEGFGAMWERILSRDIKADELEVAA